MTALPAWKPGNPQRKPGPHSGTARFVPYASPLRPYQDEVAVETTSPQQNKMDKLIEILNSMRNNSSDVDAKLTTFMEEAQNSTNSEEMLGEIVRTIYQKAVSDRSFAFTAAKLCDKMALFMVEGTKFRSLLLNMLQVTGADSCASCPARRGPALERGLQILTTVGLLPSSTLARLIIENKKALRGQGMSGQICVCLCEGSMVTMDQYNFIGASCVTSLPLCFHDKRASSCLRPILCFDLSVSPPSRHTMCHGLFFSFSSPPGPPPGPAVMHGL